MAGEFKADPEWGFRNDICECDDCKGGLTDEEKAERQRVAEAIYAIALSTVPERMRHTDRAPANIASWCGSVAGMALGMSDHAMMEQSVARGGPIGQVYGAVIRRTLEDYMEDVTERLLKASHDPKEMEESLPTLEVGIRPPASWLKARKAEFVEGGAPAIAQGLIERLQSAGGGELPDGLAEAIKAATGRVFGQLPGGDGKPEDVKVRLAAVGTVGPDGKLELTSAMGGEEEGAAVQKMLDAINEGRGVPDKSKLN